jgi:hypothetical protein
VSASLSVAVEENIESNEKAHAWLSRKWHLGPGPGPGSSPSLAASARRTCGRSREPLRPVWAKKDYCSQRNSPMPVSGILQGKELRYLILVVIGCAEAPIDFTMTIKGE